MAKEKAKHDGLLCFLLALIVVLILVIGGGAYYFLVVDNGEEIAENENTVSTNPESNVQKQENKLINLSEAERKAINKKVDTVEMAYTLGYFLSGNKTLTEEDMLKIAIFWAREEDKNYKDFGGYDIDNNAERTNIDYAKKWVKKVFNKDITINENMEYIKKIDKDLLITDFPTGFGIQVHKMQKLELNEKTNTYSLYIDELNLTEIEDNGDLVGKLEEIREQINYSEYKVVNSYVLRYKEVNGEKYIVEIVKNLNATNKTENKYSEITKELDGIDVLFVTDAIENPDNTYTLKGVIYTQYTISLKELNDILEKGSMIIENKEYIIKNSENAGEYDLFEKGRDFALYKLKKINYNEYCLETQAQISGNWKLTDEYRQITIPSDTLCMLEAEDKTVKEVFKDYKKATPTETKNPSFENTFGFAFENGKIKYVYRAGTSV